jgi:O-antigen ligase
MILSSVSVLGSYSRGAILGGIAMALALWLRSKRKLATAVALSILIPPIVLFMPERWHERIDTIAEDRKADTGQIESMRTRDGTGTLSAPIPSRDWLGYWPNDFSALGRVNAWNYAINVANQRVTGAGFESWNSANFVKYAPIIEEVQAAHSIFFGVLADHGWIGLTLFLSIFLMTWRNASWVIVKAKKEPELNWAADLTRMIQVSLIAYMVGGAFLSLAYFDLPWHLVGIVILCRSMAEQKLRAPAGDGPTRQASGWASARDSAGPSDGALLDRPGYQGRGRA